MVPFFSVLAVENPFRQKDNGENQEMLDPGGKSGHFLFKRKKKYSRM
jgi:hypothetical protein